MLKVATRSWPVLAIAATAGAGVADGAEADDPHANSPAAKHDSRALVTAQNFCEGRASGTLTVVLS